MTNQSIKKLDTRRLVKLLPENNYVVENEFDLHIHIEEIETDDEYLTNKYVVSISNGNNISKSNKIAVYVGFTSIYEIYKLVSASMFKYRVSLSKVTFTNSEICCVPLIDFAKSQIEFEKEDSKFIKLRKTLTQYILHCVLKNKRI